MAARVAIPLSYEENTMLEDIAKEYGEPKAYILKQLAMSKLMEIRHRK